MWAYKQKVISLSVVKDWPTVTSVWPPLTSNGLRGQSYVVLLFVSHISIHVIIAFPNVNIRSPVDLMTSFWSPVTSNVIFG